MKQIGGVTFIGVSLKDLNKYFKDDAVIHVSKRFLKSYEMISGIAEVSKPISINIVEKTVKVKAPPLVGENTNTSVEPEKEVAPPVELNISKGDW